MYILWSGEYEHDAEGRRTALTVNGRRTDYGYDPAGQMTSVSNEVGAFHYTWRENGVRERGNRGQT